MRALYGDDLAKLKQDVNAASVGEQETLDELKRTYEKTGYILDPHTAVGVAAARRVQHEMSVDVPAFIVLTTAHPAKFAEIIEPVIGAKVKVPRELQDVTSKQKKSVAIDAEYKSLLNVLT
jgi:threonine synthase